MNMLVNEYMRNNGYLPHNGHGYVKAARDLLNNNALDMFLYEFDRSVCESKGIVLHLLYHGVAKKDRINLSLVKPEILDKLEQAMKKGLVTEDKEAFRLTQLGWYWYVNLLYYFSPSSEQEKILQFIDKKSSEQNRYVEKWNIDLDFMVREESSHAI